MSDDLHESLRDNVRVLGDSLGRTIADDLGQALSTRLRPSAASPSAAGRAIPKAGAS